MGDVNVIVLALDPGADWAVARFDDGILMSSHFQHLPHCKADMAVIEMPKVYAGGAPPKSVIRLVLRGGMVLGRMGTDAIAEVDTVNAPKRIVEKRVYSALGALETDRLRRDLLVVPKGKRHNVVDSVRHGLVYLGRLAA